jgi:predicted Zn-dependent protease with MMP-like domain
MTDEDFEQIVRQTITSLPNEFLKQLDNVEILIEERPSNPSLLGLYHGVPKINRGIGYFALPDKITIYKEPLLRISHNEEEAKENIRDTVLHEIGHHFGLSDEELYKIKSKQQN